MPRQNQNMNLEGKIGGRKCRVRKRRCSSSSSSSLVHNYRLKRSFFVGKRGGSSTPVPIWKMMSSKSPSMENDKVKSGENGKTLPVSARKLAATLWEINGLSSPRVNRRNFGDEMSEIGNFGKEMVLEMGSKDFCFSERMDQPKGGSHRRRASAGSHKLQQGDNLGSVKSPHHCLVEVHQAQNHAQSPCRHVIGSKNRLKDVYNGLITSKELLKVMNRICRFEQQDSTSLSLFSALKFELDRACIHVQKLILEQKSNKTEIDILMKQFEEEKLIWKLKEQDRIRGSITSIAGELEIEKKLRRQTERLNKKLGTELAEIKESLSRASKDLESEKRAREILEQVCDELARGVGEDRAEVEELKKQSEKVLEEVEKEREMLQLADVLREERVQMKLSEAKYQFEEKNALVDKLRNELEAYLKSKTVNDEKRGDGSPGYDKIKELESYLKSKTVKEEKRGDVSLGHDKIKELESYLKSKTVKEEKRGDVSPGHDKIKELEKFLRETLPGPHQLYRDEDIEKVVKEDEDEDDDSSDNDLHSIELNVDELNKSFQWNDGIKKESKRNSIDKTKGRKSTKREVLSDMKLGDGVEWQFTNNKRDHLEVFDGIGLFEFSSKAWKKDVEDEMERYNMIKDLRDHIVSGSRMGSSQPSKDPNEFVCKG